jgi:hypothetical protein
VIRITPEMIEAGAHVIPARPGNVAGLTFGASKELAQAVLQQALSYAVEEPSAEVERGLRRDAMSFAVQLREARLDGGDMVANAEAILTFLRGDK